MLHIIDNYYAKTNNYGYTVTRQKKNRKTGAVTCVTLGYVGTLNEVVELVKKDILHGHIKEKDVELAQALVFLREQTERILKAMAGVEV